MPDDCGIETTPDAIADDAIKLLDNKWTIVMFKNCAGTYSAIAVRPEQNVEDAMMMPGRIVDAECVTDALYRLTERVTTGRIVGEE